MKKAKIEYLSESLKRRLKMFLELAPDKARVLTLTELEGFLHALVITPDFVSINEWLDAIFDGDKPILDEEQVMDFVETFLKAYNAYQRAYNSGKLRFPFDSSKIKTEALQETTQWCSGFTKAMLLRPEVWRLDLIAQGIKEFESLPEKDKAILTAISIIFSIANIPEFIKNKKELSVPQEQINEEREIKFELLPKVVDLLQIYASSLWGSRVEDMKRGIFDFNPEKKKIGRNEPCPCGSGKKYKKCCGKN